MGTYILATRAVPVHVRDTLAWRVTAVAERGFALLLLLVLFPVLSIAALVTAVCSRDSPFVAHERVGRGGTRFGVIKLRTMWGTEPPSGSVFIDRLRSAPVPECKARRDERVTSAFGHFCRRYSIDEIPQLWQIVRGEMALVGPRPITAEELDKHYGNSSAEVLEVLPGITGLWQVMGRSALTYRQRRTLDLFLIRRWSLSLYLFIIANTVPAVLSGRNTA